MPCRSDTLQASLFHDHLADAITAHPTPSLPPSPSNHTPVQPRVSGSHRVSTHEPGHPHDLESPVAAPLRTRLDALETKSHSTDPAPLGIFSSELESDVAFRHRGWQPNRKRVADSFFRVGIADNRRDAFRRCGSWAWVVRHPTDPDRYAVMADKCHDRFCAPCTRERSHLIASRLAERLVRKPHRLITFTIRSTNEPLTGLLDKLQTSFAKVRRIDPWRRRILGGVAFIEVHWNADKQRWHPHIHCICEGSYVPDSALQAAWYRVTGDSYVVDVRLIRDADKACQYVAKYAAKGLSRTFVRDPDRLDEAITALSGRRLANTFGTWRYWKLYETAEPLDWWPIAPLSEFRERALRGDPEAIRVLTLLKGNTPCPKRNSRDPPPPPPRADGISSSASTARPSVLAAALT